MIKNRVLLFIGISWVMLSCLGQDDPAPVKLTSFEDSLSYSFGVELGEAMKRRGAKVDPAIVAAAVREALEEKAQLTHEECMVVITTSQNKANEEIRKKGMEFLAENAKKEGVTVTESGLQYEVVTEGTGASPTVTSQVTVHYTGKLIDGTVFDSSLDRGKPSQFGVNQVIRGWTEGLQLMKEGSKYTFYIPSELGYGARGAGQAIPPHAALIFEVELIKVD